MSSPALETVNRALTLETVLARLDCDPPAGPLPARSRCPRCGRHDLVSHVDPDAPGTWSHCPSCGLRGWPFDLAAGVWGVGEAEAVRRLDARRAISDATLDGLETVALRPRREHEEAWGGWPAEPPEGARPAPGPLWGGSRPEPEDFARFAGLLGDDARPVRLGTAATPRRRKDAPELAWALAARDLPDRTRGVLFAMETAAGGLESSYRRVALGRHTPGVALIPYRECGLIGAAAAARAPGAESGVVAAVAPELWLAVQWRSAARRGAAAPLVLVPCGPDRIATGSWHAAGLAAGRPLLWGRPSARLLAQAALVDGRVSTWLPANLLGRPFEPAEVLRRARKRARPWEEALAAWLLEQPEDRLDAALADLGLPDALLRPLARGLGARGRRVLERLDAPAGPILVDGKPLMELAGRWVTKDREVSDTVVRLRRRVEFPNCPGLDHYQAEVLQDRRTLPVALPAAFLEAEEQPTWLELTARLAGGRTPEVQKHWPLKLAEAARRGRRVERVRGAAGPGFCPEAAAFAFPDWSVALGGRVRGPDALPLPAGLEGCGPPPPAPWRGEDAGWLAGPDAAPAWALAALVLAQALRAARSRPPEPVRLLGGWGTTAEALGCADARRVAWTEPLEWRWPLRWRPGAPVRCWSAAAPRLALLKNAAASRVAHLTRGGWLLDDAPAPGGGRPGAVGQLAAWGLVELCRRHLDVPGGPRPGAILRLLSGAFARETGLAPGALGPAGTRLAEAAGTGRSARLLAEAAVRALGLDLADPTVAAEPDALLEAVRHAGGRRIDAGRWKANLSDNGILRGVDGRRWILDTATLLGLESGAVG